MRHILFSLLACMLLAGAVFAANGNGANAGEDSGSKFRNARERYIESMNKWKERVGNARENAFSRGKTYVSNAVSLLESTLEVTSNHISRAKFLSGEEKQEFLERIKGKKGNLHQLSLTVENTTTGQELAEQAKLVRQEWNQVRDMAKEMVGHAAKKRMENAIGIGWKAANKSEEIIGRCDGAGFDVSQANSHLEQFKEQLAFAEQETEQAGQAFDEGNTSMGYERLRDVHRHMVEAKRLVGELRKDLKQCILKRANVALRGEGWLSAQGSGRAEITGNGTVQANFTSGSSSGKVTVIDRAGDASISIMGGTEVKDTGNSTQEGLKNLIVKVYTGASSVEVSGSKVTVILNGNSIELYAYGRGVAILSGSGTYRAGSLGNTTAFQTGAWRGNGAALHIAAAAE